MSQIDIIDDVKLHIRINFISDCHLFQADLERFVAWGESLSLFLNIQK